MAGFSVGVWIDVTLDCHSSFIVFSVDSQGGATSGMYLFGNHDNTIEFAFWRSPSAVWLTTASDVIAGRWHHVAVTWSQQHGLAMYVNGKLSSLVTSPTQNETIATTLNSRLPTDDDDVTQSCPIAVDDFNFRSRLINEHDIKELGK